MFQVFHLDVAKVDLDVAYTCMLQVNVSSVSGVSYVCCKCFHLDVAYVSNGFQVFLQVLQCMLERLHLDVSKLDRVLHMKCAWEAAAGTCDVRDE